eukprot:GEZU01017194.1.p1 GENE.GEZU01017194.1~~GEZU01017194.1.p1  ORF type:complete len:209 (-),score=57.52 GEZU01017194.1:1474-2100(-)
MKEDLLALSASQLKVQFTNAILAVCFTDFEPAVAPTHPGSRPKAVDSKPADSSDEEADYAAKKARADDEDVEELDVDGLFTDEAEDDVNASDVDTGWTLTDEVLGVFPTDLLKFSVSRMEQNHINRHFPNPLNAPKIFKAKKLDAGWKNSNPKMQKFAQYDEQYRQIQGAYKSIYNHSLRLKSWSSRNVSKVMTTRPCQRSRQLHRCH